MAMGLHARPANIFAKKATEFESNINIIKDGKEANGKRLLAVLTLGAKQGDLLTIKIDGADESEAAATLKNLFDENFGE